MNLKDALLCIDCDEVFTFEGSVCNPRCPSCASSIFVPLSGWVQTWTAYDSLKGETSTRTCADESKKRRRIEIVHIAPIAA